MDQLTLGLQHRITLLFSHHRMALGVAGDTDRGQAISFEDAGLDQRRGIGVGACRCRWVAGDGKAALNPGLPGHGFDHGGEFLLIFDSPRRHMRHGLETERADFTRRAQTLLQ